MSVMQPEPALPSIPSAGRLSTATLYPQGTPAMQRLEVNAPIVGPATGNPSGYVYMGKTLSEERWRGFPFKTNQRQRVEVDQLVPISDARYMMETLAPEAKQRLYDTATRYYGGTQWEQSWLDNIWERAINVSANSYAYANKRIDPVTAFEMIVGDLERSGQRPGGAGGGGGGGPTTTRQISESVNLTDPGTARTLLKNSLTEYLGRDATDKEQQAFLRALNAAEEQAPTVTEAVTTTTPGAGTATVRSRTMTRGGFNPSTFAQEYAQSQEGAAEYQAATSLLDTFIGTLRARV